MKLPIYSVVAVGYGLTIFFVVDFVAFLLVNNLLVRTILGIILLLGAIRFYFGSKSIKKFEFSSYPPKIKLEYYKSKK